MRMKKDNLHLPWDQRLAFRLLIQHSRLSRVEQRLSLRLLFLLFLLRLRRPGLVSLVKFTASKLKSGMSPRKRTDRNTWF